MNFPIPPMNFRLVLALLLLAYVVQSGFAQSKFHITFRGTAYQKAPDGNMTPVTITERTLLEEAARDGGVTDLSTLALVYHVNGSSFGDTIDVVNSTNGVPYRTFYGFFFGQDASLNRTAITNAAGTDVRRIDYIYTSQSSHSMGTGFVSKRYIRDSQGNPRATIDGGQLQWIVLPAKGDSAKMCKATFTTVRPFVPRP